MKNIKKLSLSLLLITSVGTTQTRKEVETVGSAVSEAPASILDYTVFLPATAQQNEDNKSSNDRSVGQTVMTPVTAAVDLVPDVLSFGHSKQLDTDFGDNDKPTKEKRKKSKQTEKSKATKKKKSKQKKERTNNMTSNNADSLL